MQKIMDKLKNVENYKKSNRINTQTKEKGITLIALIITVIVLLIIAGVTLNLTLRRKRNI